MTVGKATYVNYSAVTINVTLMPHMLTTVV